jgi:aspartate aminotransferase-like enzyme
MKDLEDNLFMIPGPVKIHPRVLRVMSKPSMGHRTPEYRAMIKEMTDLLQYLFQSQNEVSLLSGSGTAGLDCVMTNLLKKDEKAIVVYNGKFGERLFELAEFYGKGVPVTSDYGKALDLDRIAAVVEKERPKLVGVCHNETSTGFTNDAERLSKIAHDNDALFVLDGITSIGGLDVPCDKWGVDAAIFGSQKCVAAPAGLAGVCISPEAKKQLHDDKSYYLHLKWHLDKWMQKNDTPYTSAIPLFLAMHQALLMLKEEGLPNRIRRCARLAEACRTAAKAIGLGLLAQEGYRSNTVTAILYPQGIEDGKFRSIMWEKHRVLVAGGQSVVKGKIFRIGHMGICSFTDMLATWGAVEATLKELGYKFDMGAGVAAVEQFIE